jgi:hypothetical protein
MGEGGKSGYGCVIVHGRDYAKILVIYKGSATERFDA